MKAILKTRCGCTREIEISWPPSRWFRIPLMPDLSLSAWVISPDINKNIQVREFELQPGSKHPAETAHYLERMP